MKKIVVLVALYKAGEHLAGKLRNLKVQTYFDQAQIVLLNCQNLDGESSIYADFVRDNQNVYTIEYDYHVTLYDSWNDGLKRTQSEYVTNANVDDRWHPSYLEVMSKYLDDHQDVGVVSSNVLTTSIPNATFPWEPDGAYRHAFIRRRLPGRPRCGGVPCTIAMVSLTVGAAQSVTP